MALVRCGKDTYIDTDDLEQAEYHYYCKAKRLGKDNIARKILTGLLTADEIDNSDEFEWLATK